MVKIKFLGAAQTVTGSCYLVETNNSKFLIDCGMFQGPEVEHLNLEDLNFDASKIDFVLLTHAHIDHSGMLPKLIVNGFDGPIYATHHTIQITSHLLLDSAKLQENAYKKGEPYGKYTQVRGIVYNTKDANQTIQKFKVQQINEFFSPIENTNIRFIKAGHILGAVSIEIVIQEEEKDKKIVFSGDIGRLNSHLDQTFDVNHRWDPEYVIMESLYGSQIHPDRDESARELIKIISETTSKGGNVYIPSFAVQRTQEILNDIKNAKDFYLLPENLEVWLDSPLAQKVTEIYVSALQENVDNLFDFPGLRYIKKYSQSVALNKKRGIVVIAGSGMADGGRILNHFERCLENRKNSIVFVGFQAEGTLGRELVEGSKNIKIGRKNIKVRSNISHLTGFSAHGDKNDYVSWLNRYNNVDLRKVFLVHAEPQRSAELQEILNTHSYNSIIPERLSEFIL